MGHSGKALEFGAEAEEVAAAIEIGKLVRKGAAAKMGGAKDPICCGS